MTTVAIDDPGDLTLLGGEHGTAWIRRGEGMVGWGEAARFDASGPDRIDDAASWWRRVTRHAEVSDEVRVPGSGLVAFGSFAFADASAAGGSLVVPRVIVGRRGEHAWITLVGDEPMPDLTPTPAPAVPAVTVAQGNRAAWSAAVHDAVARIEAGEIEKVVLARAVEALAEAPIDARSLVSALEPEFPNCWTFHVDGLVGATPELLARIDHGLVTSRILAGTIRRTGDETADLAHAAALAKSSKDREEHEYAARSVTEVLEQHCGSINVPDEPFVLHLPNVMHLATDVTGVLSHNASALEMIAQLHPSAAVCGTPTVEAARVIDELEDFDRARYAGPVGWINAHGDGEWCIGLRSAEIDQDNPNRLRLFAGCGIVAGSDADAEWVESEAKLEPMLGALGVRAQLAP